MSAKMLENSECDVVIVDRSELMRNTLKDMIFNDNHKIYEASDEIDALNLATLHNPKIVFISMEDNNYWEALVQSLKKDYQCTIIGYSKVITREAVASAYFAGVDDILINPKDQKERIDNYITKTESGGEDRYYKFPGKNSRAGLSPVKKFFWLQAE